MEYYSFSDRWQACCGATALSASLLAAIRLRLSDTIHPCSASSSNGW